METLVDRFKARIQEIDASEPSPQPKPKALVRLFNIFKRSLPVAYNKLVFQNVTEEDINFLFRNVLRPKKNRDDESVMYWDAVEIGTSDGWNVFSNEGIDTTNIREGTNINTYRESPKAEIDWRG